MSTATTSRAHRPANGRRSRKDSSAERGPSPEDKLVADLIALIEQGTAPWRREWQGHQGVHRNLLTGHAYRGSNPLLLEFGALLKSHTLPLWLGGAQAKAQGWFPRKGSSAVRIVRPQLNHREQVDSDGAPLRSAEGETLTTSWVSYKIVPVFNAADLTGTSPEAQQALEAAIASALHLAGPPATPAARLEHAESVLEAWPVSTIFGGALACYSPAADRIAMPAPEAFLNREAYAATWAHEQIHSTGHPSRLERPQSGAMGTAAYAREELVAELGAVIVCQRLQIGSDFQNHAAYLSHWAELLREKPSVLFQLLSAARQAADLIAPELTGAAAADDVTSPDPMAP
jgi:antirestriction protein ArdC